MPINARNFNFIVASLFWKRIPLCNCPWVKGIFKQSLIKHTFFGGSRVNEILIVTQPILEFNSKKYGTIIEWLIEYSQYS